MKSRRNFCDPPEFGKFGKLPTRISSSIFIPNSRKWKMVTWPAISSLSPNGLSTLGSRIIRSSFFVRAIRFYSALRGFPETAGPAVLDRTLQVVVLTIWVLPAFLCRYHARRNGRERTDAFNATSLTHCQVNIANTAKKAFLDGYPPLHQGLRLKFLKRKYFLKRKII